MSWDMRPTAMIAGDVAGAGDQRRSCFCCGEVGHFVRDCLKRGNRKSPGAALICFACGGPGHFARYCPNKFTPNRTRNHPSRSNRTAGITGAGGVSAGRGEGGPNRTAGITRATGGTSAVGGEGCSNRTAGITRATGTRGEGGPNRTAGITRAAGGTSAFGGEVGPNRTAGITRAAGTIGEGGPNHMSAFGGEGGHTAGITRGGEGGPNRTAGITRAAGTSAVGGEDGPNRMSTFGGTSVGGGEADPNHTVGITPAVSTSTIGGEGGPNRMSTFGGEGGPNHTVGITRAANTSAVGGEGVSNRMSAFGCEGGPNRTAGITRADGASAVRGEGGPNHRAAAIIRACLMSTVGGEGGLNSTGGITRTANASDDCGGRGEGTGAGAGGGAGGGEGGPNCTIRITRAHGTGADGGLWIRRRELPADQSKDSSSISGGGVGGVCSSNQRSYLGMGAGRGLWIRHRELPADQSKDSSSINGGGIGGVSSSNQRSYLPPTLSPEYGGNGSSPEEPVNESYYDTGKYFGSSGSSSSREYLNLLNNSKGDCVEGSSGSSKDGGEGSSARGLFLNEISSSSSGNDFDDDDYKDYDMWLSRALLSEGKILEKRCGFVAKVSEGIDGERPSNGKYTTAKSFNNNGTASRGPAVIEISSSSSEDEDGLIVRKKITGFLFPTGKVKEEIKRIVDDDDDEDDDYGDDDDDDDDDCVILDYNPFETPTADFEQVSLSEHKSSIAHDEDITVISERGQVACRDYPHSRHHCGKFPFSKTTHESCCPQCYCYICEVVAPCEYWDGSCGHCHASDQDPIWDVMKKIRRDL